ncbi:MAG: hypothetical protein IT160_12195 [Bryobacterales bacterium]|nr:hypothetical protein [Bryobacterales bacterium]
MSQFSQALDRAAAGAVDLLITHWKTSGSGTVLTVMLGFVLFAPQYFPPLVVDFMKYLTVAGVLTLGVTARDRQKNK